MPTAIIDTSDKYTKGIVDYSVYLIGDWPNIKFRYDWKFRIRIDGWGSWYLNGCTFKFHNTSVTCNINVSLPSGGYSGYIATGTTDIAWSGGSNTCTQEPAISITTARWSGSTKIKDTLTIPNPSVCQIESVTNLTPNSVDVKYLFTTERKFWRAKILNVTSGEGYDTNLTSGSTYKVSGLSANTAYQFAIGYVDRNGVQKGSGPKFSFRTLVDQLRVFIKNNGTVKKAKTFIKVNGSVRKVKAAFIKVNGSVRKVKNIT